MRTWYFYGLENKNWQFGFWYIGLDCWSLGISIWLGGNLEIHVPTGFFIFGRRGTYCSGKDI